MPHIHCYLGKPPLVWTMFITDFLIGLAYVCISISLYILVRKIKLPFSPMFIAFGMFIFACGLTHFMEVYTLWIPAYWTAALFKVMTATASVFTAYFLYRISPKITRFAEAAKKSEQRGIDLARQTEELILANQELKAAQERFTLLIEGVRDYAIFSLDPEGRIISWNEGARRITNYTVSEVIDKHYSLLFTQDELDQGLPGIKLEEATKHGRWEDECFKVKKDGTKFWVRDYISAIRDANNNLTGFTVIIRDMTEEKVADEKLSKAFDELEQRVKDRTTELESALQNRDEFLSIASHELKTPLTSMHMQLQILDRRMGKLFEEHGPPGQTELEKIKLCLQQSGKLSELIDELLDLTRIRGGRLKLALDKTDMVTIVNDVLKTLEVPIRKGPGKIEFDYDPSLSYVGNWDQMRIEQVITNLVTNAIKYGEHKPVTITLKKNEERVSFIIKDHGIGMSSELQKRIFERFARGSYDNRISGLGLGLYISKQIVLAHGGYIHLTSAEGIGSRFEVILPVNPFDEAKNKGDIL